MARWVSLVVVVGMMVGASACSVDTVTFRTPSSPLPAEDCAVDGDEDGNGAADCDDVACAATPACMVAMPATCTDGQRNEEESDVDCGGSCPRCNDGAACGSNGDCASGLCGNQVCVRAASCREIRERSWGTVDGTYSVDLDGAESGAPFAVKCVGMSAAGFEGCSTPESNFLDDGPSTDDDPFGELYYR